MQSERNDLPESGRLKVPEWASGLRAPGHSVREAEALVKRHYGIDARLFPLDGERDQNFLVTADGAQQWVLKIGSGMEPSANVDYQAALLSWLEETAPHLPLPRNIDSKQGDPYLLHQFDNGERGAVRLVTYLEGRPLSAQGHRIDGWAGQTGAFQGRLCCALRDFDHVAAGRFLPWNASSEVMLCREMLAYLEPDCASLTAPHLDRLRSTSLPALREMRSQVIHNDIHPGNVLVDGRGRISGIIDFGDAIRAPVIQELAVSATSLVEFSPTDSQSLIPDLIEGFCSVYPLHSDELALLYDAVLLRSILSVALGRMKDRLVPSAQRPRAATKASETGLDAILKLERGLVSGPRSGRRSAHG